MLLMRKQASKVKRARDEGSKCESKCEKQIYLNYFFILWFLFVVFCLFCLFFVFIILLFCFLFFFIFFFWLVFILTLSTFAFSICKGEGISFLYFSQRLFIILLLLITAVVTLNTSSIRSFVLLFEPDKDNNKNKN